MSHIGLADLLGVRGKSIRWERPFLFFGALFIADLVWLVIYPFVNWLSSTGVSTWVSPPHSWLMVLLADLLMAVLAVVAFRLIPNAAIAAPAVAIVYALLNTLIRFAVFSISYEEGIREQILAQLWRPTSLLFGALATGCFLGGMALALRWIEPVWLALWLGAIAGHLVSWVVTEIIDWPISISLIEMLRDQWVFPILEKTIFAVAFGAGPWLVSTPVSAIEDAASSLSNAGAVRLPKGLYVGTIAVTLGLAGVLSIMSITMMTTGTGMSRGSDPSQLLSILAIAVLMAIIGGIIMMTLVYKMWASIQDGYARTSPGKALGFMFIPLFNLYWAFQVFPGFAHDFNAFAARHSINAPHLPAGLFTTYVILCLLAAIPVIGLFLVPINFFVGLIMVSKICDAVNSIPEKPPAPGDEGPKFQMMSN